MRTAGHTGHRSAGRAPRGRGAFTLVEVLASLVLVGVILPAAMAGVSLAMGMEETARGRTEAAVLAGSKLAELTATGAWQTAETEGDFGEHRPAYSWRLQVEEWEEPGLSRVVVTVERTAARGALSVTVSTLAYAEER